MDCEAFGNMTSCSCVGLIASESDAALVSEIEVLRGALRERRVLNFDSAFARSSSIRFLTASCSAPSAETNVCASLSPCSKGVSDMLPIGFLSSVDSNHSAFCNNNHDGPWEKYNYCMRKKYNFPRIRSNCTCQQRCYGCVLHPTLARDCSLLIE